MQKISPETSFFHWVMMSMTMFTQSQNPNYFVRI